MAARPAVAKKRPAQIGAIAEDAHTTRSASSRVSSWEEGRQSGREMDLTIEVWQQSSAPGITPRSGVSVECIARSFSDLVESTKRTIQIEDAELGDLPLIIAGLQDAIRVGVENGSFPEIRVTES